MPPSGNAPTTAQDVQNGILASIEEQIRDLQPTLDNSPAIAGLLADLNHLSSLLSVDATQQAVLTPILKDVQSILDGIKPGTASDAATMSNFGPVLESLYLLEAQLQVWVTQQAGLTDGDQAAILALVAGTITQVRQLLNYRPDVGAVMEDLAAMKSLQGGPADATAFHDFHVLQLALRDVWIHLFDNNLKNAAGELYDQANKLYADAGLTLPDPGEIADLNQLTSFMNDLASVTGIVIPPPSGVSKNVMPGVSNIFTFGLSSASTGAAPSTAPPVPPAVSQFFPSAGQAWTFLSDGQRSNLVSLAQDYQSLVDELGDGDLSLASATQQSNYYTQKANDILAAPEGTGGRLAQLMVQLAQAQSEPYAFDVFAPNSYNFGLVLTYRQIWQPGPYQAGDLVSTIPLAPGETRKYSHKQVVKETVSRRTAEKSTETRSQQSSQDSRAERDIMNRASSATNFKLTTHGSFNIGIGSMDTTSEFGGNSGSESTQNKKDFHEATLKAAEEYRLERSLEIDTSRSVETEDVTSGEISNPNNEITVTYLFYELQRRYTIREFLYRVQPVIMIAQDVPSPEQINEAWLLQYQWIISRVLMDDSLRPALNYLSSGYAGDQFSTSVLETQWKTQAALVQTLESLVTKQLTARDQMRNTLIDETQEKDSIPEMPGVLNIFTLGMNPSDDEKKLLNAQIKAGETRLKYAEQALADAQSKLSAATSVYQQATKDYAAALRNQYSRQVAIDQLRLEIKRNILYYMQAIWAHEDSDQRYFRLYRQQVMCPNPNTTCSMPVVPFRPGAEPTNPTLKKPNMAVNRPGMAAKVTPEKFLVNLSNICLPGLGPGGQLSTTTVDLASIADLDNPLGYKGNYILFPLTGNCPLTDYMLSEYIDSNYGVGDPDGSDSFDPQEFDDEWQVALAANDQGTLATLQKYLKSHIEQINRESDEIIVPTGQLFIEALPGSHPLLEDFKLLHRAEDIKSVQAQNRFAELENLRLASRLAANPPLLQDPHIDKRIVVDQGVGVVMDTNP